MISVRSIRIRLAASTAIALLLSGSLPSATVAATPDPWIVDFCAEMPPDTEVGEITIARLRWLCWDAWELADPSTPPR